MYVEGRGLRGAYWANFLTAGHSALAGGESTLRAALPGMRIESLLGYFYREQP